MNQDLCYCDGRGGLDRKAPSVSRRGFLAGAIGALGLSSALGEIVVDPNRSRNDVLVVVFLRGGADGLSLVAPYAEDNYYRARPTLAVRKPGREANTLLDLNGFFGLNPALSALMPYYEDKSMAIVHATGSLDESRSHFEAMSAMERGRARATDGEGGGWLARHLAVTPGASSPFRAVAFDAMLPESLTGASSAMAIENIDSFRLQNDDDQAYRKALAALYAEGGDPFAKSGRETLRLLDVLREKGASTPETRTGVTYAENGFAQALRQVSFLIKQDIGLEIACVSSYGWDTHVAQGTNEGWLPTLLRDLGNGLDAFMKDLGPETKRVTVVVQTEFGRRVDENSGFGTDHGRGGALFALGAGVQGGKVFGEWPGLSKEILEGPGDLPVTTDYRNVLAEVLERRMGNQQTAQVFPNHRLQPIGIIA